MNTLILNRDFQHPSDGWYQIEAKGNHPNRAAGVVQAVDDEATQSIVNRFNADAAAGKLRHGAELLIDHEHFSDQPDQETRAYGWLQELQNREDGIYGRIRWTATGKAAVDGGDYRFFSTEYDPADLKVVNDAKVKTVRPLRLAGLSLTNMNNNRGQKPITNRVKDEPPHAADPNFADVSASADNQKLNQGKQMKSVCTALGLSADAAEDVVLAEVTKLRNSIATIEPLQSENTTLKNRNAELEGDQCETLMDAHGMKPDAPSRIKLKPVLIGLKNREERVSFLKECVTVVPPPVVLPQTKLFNRATTPPGGAAQADEGDEQGVAVKITNRTAELRATGLKFDTAWAKAKKEITGK